MKKRSLFPILTLLISCMLITGCSGGDEHTPPETKPEVSANTLEAWGFSFELPDYCQGPSYQDEKGYRYDIGDEALIDLTATDIPDMDPDKLNFDAQRESTPERPVLNTEDITVADMKGIVQTLDIYENADERAWFLVDEENKRIFLFTVMQNDATRTRDYIADFEKVLASMKRIDGGDIAKETSKGTEYADGDWKAAYAGVLKANEESIRAYDWQEDINHEKFLNNVLIYDLNGDDTSELLFMTGGALHVYTMKDGRAAECVYDVTPEATLGSDSNAAFVFVAAGGGMNYMVYSGNEKGAFYVAHNIWDTNMASKSLKYIMDDEGLITLDTAVYNVSGMESGKDKYTIDGKPVSSGEAVGVLKDHRDDYKELLMYNMKYGSLEQQEDFKVFSRLKTDKPLAGSYDDVMKELSE